MNKHSVSVAGVIIRDDGKMLVIKRADNGEYQIPGGVLEINEAIETGLHREIFEETGIYVKIDALTGVYKNLKLGVVALVFVGSYVSGQVQLSEETSEVAWLSTNEAVHKMKPVFSQRVIDALSRSVCPAIRNHDGINFI